MNYVLIVGAKGDMAQAIAREYARNGYDLYLAGRDVDVLSEYASDLMIRFNVDVKLTELDVLDYVTHEELYASLSSDIIGVVCTAGYLGDNSLALECFSETERIINTNYTGIVSLCNIAARDLESKRKGFLVCISSVAGDRGRQSNYIYGSAKAGLTAYLSGLRNRLNGFGVQVLTVKPGFVYTQMTAHLSLPAILTAHPEKVATAIYSAQQKGKSVIYIKGVWRWIMMAIKMIPEWKFKSMDT